ncbi:MAG: RNA polymerase sigma factor RpoD, partial [Betaproteobacteria bacterium]
MQARILAKIKTKAKDKSRALPATLVKHHADKIKEKTKKEIKKKSITPLKTVVKEHSRVVVIEKKPARIIANKTRKVLAVVKKSTRAVTNILVNKGIAVTRSPLKTSAQVTEIAKAIMASKKLKPFAKKMKLRTTREARAQAKEAERALLGPQDLEARRIRLKSLIVQGKERGYLTYAEINDHLPDDMQDAEQIEGIIRMINDMGIFVYDEAPDVEALLLSDTSPVVTDEDVTEEAEAAFSTVDSEFGRTTDPVRMYMREMGSVELLTREGEIEIAKRIESGLKHMIKAISICPTTIAGILDFATKVAQDEMRIDELVDGLLDPNAQEIVCEEISDESLVQELDARDGEDEDSAAIAGANLLKLKISALERFSVIFNAYTEMKNVIKKNGASSIAYKEIQEHISAELMAIRFSAKMVERLCNTQREMVEEVRSYEREIMELSVVKAGMPSNHFIKVFPGNETNLNWVTQEVAADRSYSQVLARYQPAIMEQQKNLLSLQRQVGIPIKELKE